MIAVAFLVVWVLLSLVLDQFAPRREAIGTALVLTFGVAGLVAISVGIGLIIT